MSESEVSSTEIRWRNYQQLIWTQQQIQLQIQQQQQYQNTKMSGIDNHTDGGPPIHPNLTQLLQPEMSEKPLEETTKETTDPWDNFDAHAAFLGPTLWDKRLPYDGQDFKLEYVDLEEFLTENGIPMDSSAGSSLDHNFGKNHQSTSGLRSPTQITNSNGCLPQNGMSTENQILAGPSRIQGHPHGSGQMRSSIVHHNHRSRSPSPCESDSASSGITHDMTSSDVSPDSSQTGELAHGTPGHEFDPRTRSFTEDELKPQPMIKKSRKQFVPDDAKDIKYWARRRKNNMAAKRSRDARRVKENQIAMRACFLEKENMALKQEIERIQKENIILKEQLRCCRRDH